MKFRLVEVLEQPFNETLELEYEASEVCDEEDEGKVSGYVTVNISPSSFVDAIWDIMTEDKKSPVLTEDEFEHFAEDNDAFESYLKDNFDMLVDKYDDELHKKFFDIARDKLYDQWDSYSDEDAFSQRDEDTREFWRNVWGR